MASILMIWEQGSGLGHLSTMFPIANSLRDGGHQVHVAVKDFSKSHLVFDKAKFSLLPCPVFSGPIKGKRRLPSTFAEIMHNIGFGDVEILSSLVGAWQAIFELVKPDLIITDHSPVAMLAARARSIKLVTLGTGFSCPGSCESFPDWRPEQGRLPEELLSSERQVLANANQVLSQHQVTPLERLSDLYRDCDDCLLVTYPGLDPFGLRDEDYLGVFPDKGGLEPRWPDDGRPKVFAYLRPIHGIENLLAALSSSGLSAMVRMPGATADMKAMFPAIQWEDKFVDLATVASQVKFCIGHGTHMMSARWLLFGKPILMIPPYLEQYLTVRKVLEMGAGMGTAMTDLAGFEKIIGQMQREHARIEEAAKSFAGLHQATPANEGLNRAIGKVLKVLDNASRRL